MIGAAAPCSLPTAQTRVPGLSGQRIYDAASGSLRRRGSRFCSMFSQPGILESWEGTRSSREGEVAG